jgi:ERCC4-type nuclease
MPLPLFDNHPNWIAAERRATLKTGDYTIDGMEDLLALERKTLADAVNSAITNRGRFIAACARLAAFRWKAILIEAAYEDLKSPFKGLEDIESDAHPNAVSGTLDAIEAKFGIPIIYTSRDRGRATERAASWLSKHFTYWWLEQNGHDRILIDTDRL